MAKKKKSAVSKFLSRAKRRVRRGLNDTAGDSRGETKAGKRKIRKKGAL